MWQQLVLSSPELHMLLYLTWQSAYLCYQEDSDAAEPDKAVAALMFCCHLNIARHWQSCKEHFLKLSLVRIREVAKAVRMCKVQSVIVAPNIEQIESEGGLDDLLASILQQADQADIPVVFALSRKKLGQVRVGVLAVATGLWVSLLAESWSGPQVSILAWDLVKAAYAHTANYRACQTTCPHEHVHQVWLKRVLVNFSLITAGYSKRQSILQDAATFKNLFMLPPYSRFASSCAGVWLPQKDECHCNTGCIRRRGALPPDAAAGSRGPPGVATAPLA